MKKRLFLTLSILAALAAPTPSLAQQGIGIAAVVDKETVTVYELDARTRLILATSGIRPTKENLARLRTQVLETLITEKLQLQEARRLNITVSESRIDAAIASIEQRNNIPKGQLVRILRLRGVSITTLRDQVRAAIAWATVVGRQIRQNVSISDADVTAELTRLSAYKNQTQYRLREIYLPASNSQQARTAIATSNRLIQQIRLGANFGALARQFSQSGTASVGGDMGVLLEGQLEPSVRAAIARLRPGQVIGPVRSAGGYYIFQLVARETIGKATEEKGRVTYAQVAFRFTPTQTPNTRDELRRRALELTRFKGDCPAFVREGEGAGATVNRIARSVPYANMAADLRKVLEGTKPGDVTKIVENRSGVFVLMHCKPEVAALPSRSEIRQQLERREVEVRAQRLIRDLRRSAYIDKRI